LEKKNAADHNKNGAAVGDEVPESPTDKESETLLGKDTEV